MILGVPHSFARFERKGWGLRFSPMPKGLKRYYGQRHLHFITCSCYQRLPFLRSARARNVFAKILSEVRDAYGFALVGYVVMPEHIHLLISEPAKGTPSTVMQVLKQRVSRQLRRKRRKTSSAGQLRLRFGGRKFFRCLVLVVLCCFVLFRVVSGYSDSYNFAYSGSAASSLSPSMGRIVQPMTELLALM